MADESSAEAHYWRSRLAESSMHLSVLYGGAPVYLVGSGIANDDPRDVDIVIPIRDDVFVAYYGEFGKAWNPITVAESIDEWIDDYNGLTTSLPKKTWRNWARDCARRNLTLSKTLHKLVDFKTQPEKFFNERDATKRKMIADGTWK